jgi:hypothetical protein
MTITRVSFSAVICWIPVAAFALLMVFASIASKTVGHWPYYSHPDPKDLGLPYLHSLALFGIPIGLLSAFVGIIGLIGAHEQWRRWHIGIFVVGVLLWALNMGQVGRLLNWLLD